jgi:hypothetical protein
VTPRVLRKSRQLYTSVRLSLPLLIALDGVRLPTILLQMGYSRNASPTKRCPQVDARRHLWISHAAQCEPTATGLYWNFSVINSELMQHTDLFVPRGGLELPGLCGLRTLRAILGDLHGPAQRRILQHNIIYLHPAGCTQSPRNVQIQVQSGTRSGTKRAPHMVLFATRNYACRAIESPRENLRKRLSD